MLRIVENTPRQLVLMSGSTSLTLDKDTGKATFQRKFLFWKLKPIEAQLADIAAVNVDNAVDRASGVEIYNTMLVARAGAGWMLSAKNKTEAENDALALLSLLKTRSVRIDCAVRQGSDTQQYLRTVRSGVCGARPSRAKREFALRYNMWCTSLEFVEGARR
jgi:hypothetical protein